ncbi:MAG TPA: hypothetical protein VMU81_18940 [Acetobacteraceae bacterium]|jgi:hypothetical protein|nr:hypothetical protein [Acetobacteraceae bacterium]
MPAQSRAGGQSRRLPPQTEPPEPKAALLENLAGIEDEDNILVIGQDGPDLMCALMRAGAAQVTHLRSLGRPEADSASLAIVPQVPSIDWLSKALPSIRRALHANGRLVLSFAAQPITKNLLRRVLAVHGFTAVRTRRARTGQILTAELPAFGMRRYA